MSEDKRIEIYDTTLRDGAQQEGISFSLSDKLRVTRCLVELGIPLIEGGFPGSNKKEIQYFKKVQSLDLGSSKIVAFGMTCRKGKKAEEDKGLNDLLAAGTDIVALVGKSDPYQVEVVLQASLEENLRIIRDSVSFLTSKGKYVIFDAEHLFDGWKCNPDYALATLKAAVDEGAGLIVLCDTNGGTMPEQVTEITENLVSQLSVPVGIHCHNDCDLAVVNSLAGVEAGAVQVQGTLNGWGERCGNARLTSVIANLQVKKEGYFCLEPGQLVRLTEISRAVSEITNLAPDQSSPFVGSRAFTHGGGMHSSAELRCPGSYTHTKPALFGGQSRTTVSELAGLGVIMAKAKEFGLVLSKSQARGVLGRIESMENQGYHFEAAGGSVELLMKQTQDGYQPPFEIKRHKATMLVEEGRGTINNAVVTVQINKRKKRVTKCARGDGEVDALANALQKALSGCYPVTRKVALKDYKVRILDEDGKGTAAKVRVLIDFSDGKRSWTTVGVSDNVVEASWIALTAGIELAILKSPQKQRKRFSSFLGRLLNRQAS